MIRVILVSLVLITCGLLDAAEPYDIDEEIARVKRELGKVESERSKVKKDRLKDKADFAAYSERTSSRILNLKNHTDSLSLRIKEASLINDSIESELMNVNVRIRQQELNQKRLRETLQGVCRDLLKEIDSLPPLAGEQIRGSLSYLAGEISAGSIDNTEAMNRFMQICRDLQTLSAEIQSVEGLSPVGQLKGTVYRLRIGTVLEAVVDTKGEQVFFWDRGVGQWRAEKDPVIAQSVLQAVKIREGKTVPSLIQMPFGSGEREVSTNDR